DQQRTLLLTTHYMMEADELCDRVAIINRGKVLACDTPAALKTRLQREAIFRMEVSPLDGLRVEQFEHLNGVRKVTHQPQDGYSLLEMILEKDDVLASVVNLLTSADMHILNLHKREPTLEDVFVALVGSSMEEVERAEQEGEA
ncbi:MAG: ATP-binding protein DrrA1-3 family domain-containing protein, partial [Anaerolineales bacterium]